MDKRYVPGFCRSFNFRIFFIYFCPSPVPEKILPTPLERCIYHYSFNNERQRSSVQEKWREWKWWSIFIRRLLKIEIGWGQKNKKVGKITCLIKKKWLIQTKENSDKKSLMRDNFHLIWRGENWSLAIIFWNKNWVKINLLASKDCMSIHVSIRIIMPY